MRRRKASQFKRWEGEFSKLFPSIFLMSVSVGSGGERHRYRENIVYRSLRRSSSQIVVNIKKKINEAEKSVRYRRALRPLNESRSPSPAPKMRIVAPAPIFGKKKTGVVAHLRGMATLLPTKKGLRRNCSPNAVRLAKQVARTRIREIQSPRRPLLNFPLHDRDGDLFSELKDLQRPH
ncbi:hypothetical protein GCK32_010192 [Trichostrongylus colubriformis]|uniref:Uncharacterized protein n=1 Tax=Trichostrongylus colubriformis TaxID=6319 RepID=A0AAN8FQH5_TRICO